MTGDQTAILKIEARALCQDSRVRRGLGRLKLLHFDESRNWNEPARSVRYLSEWNESSSEILDSLLHTAETESNTHVLSHCRNGFIFHAYSDLALKTITEFPSFLFLPKTMKECGEFSQLMPMQEGHAALRRTAPNGL